MSPAEFTESFTDTRYIRNGGGPSDYNIINMYKMITDLNLGCTLTLFPLSIYRTVNELINHFVYTLSGHFIGHNFSS